MPDLGSAQSIREARTFRIMRRNDLIANQCPSLPFLVSNEAIGGN